ncbi:MAG: choice-of-anchor D domain-containing protein [Bacteroidetes bacterium]|nr:choice-of-anchor D domain-containing protein [Bacteroidota bacterium]
MVIGLLHPIPKAHGQWKQVGQFSEGVLCVYFSEFDSVPLHGYVSIKKNVDALLRTSDGGNTWSTIPGSLAALSVLFVDPLNGWYVYPDVNGTHVTTDGGLTWNQMGQGSPPGWDIYYNAKKNLLIQCSWDGTLYTSRDRGLTWNRIEPNPSASGASGLTFFNDSTGFASSASTTNCYGYRTTDGGETWSTSQFRQECWKPHTALPSGTFFAPAEWGGNGLSRSSDGGASWSLTSGQPQSSLIGHMQGDDCRLYIHTVDGVYRSLDSGQTWQFIGGPPNTYDTRALYSRGKHVYAGGSDGSLWYLYDTIPDPRLRISQDIINFDSVSACADPVISVRLTNFRICDAIKIDSIYATNATIKAFQVIGSPLLPSQLSAGSTDSIGVRFITTPIGKYYGRLHIRYSVDGATVDTVLTIGAVRVRSASSGLSTYHLAFDTISVCQSVARTLSLVNNNCDSAILDLASTPGAGFTVLSPSMPYQTAPGEKVDIHIRYTPSATGPINTILTFRLRTKSASVQTFDLRVDGYADTRFATPALAPTVVDFGSVPLCTGATSDTLALLISNPSGCDSVRVRTGSVPDTEFELVDVLPTTTVGPGGITQVRLVNHPTSKGRHLSTLALEFFDGTTWRDTTVQLAETVTDGTRILSSSRQLIDFGTTTLCDERDSVVTLYNSGCDTLLVVGYRVQGVGFSVGAPDSVRILPGQSVNIPVTTFLDTTGGMFTNYDTLSFISNADNTIPPVYLSRSYSLPKRYSFHMISTGVPSGTSGDFVRFALVSDQAQLAGVQMIDYDLTLNTDLLELTNTSGPNTVKVVGNHITITGNPNIQITSDGSIAQFEYQVYLTTDSATNLTATNFHLNNADPKFEACVASASTRDTAFEYLYRCGNRELQQYMRTGVVRITSIRPNPSSGAVTLSVQAVTSDAAEIELVNALGAVVKSGTQMLRAGANEIELPTESLANGVYYVRVRSGGNTVGGSVAIER